jgi:hypothetical protein
MLPAERWLDGALYPDTDPPLAVHNLADRVDFLARLCAAWDFGLLPAMETVREIRQPVWREAVEVCQLLTSPTYHLVRRWHGLRPMAYLGQRLAYIAEDANLQYI